MARILVTGASGFIGYAVTGALAGRGTAEPDALVGAYTHREKRGPINCSSTTTDISVCTDRGC